MRLPGPGSAGVVVRRPFGAPFQVAAGPFEHPAPTSRSRCRPPRRSPFPPPNRLGVNVGRVRPPRLRSFPEVGRPRRPPPPAPPPCFLLESSCSGESVLPFEGEFPLRRAHRRSEPHSPMGSCPSLRSWLLRSWVSPRPGDEGGASFPGYEGGSGFCHQKTIKLEILNVRGLAPVSTEVALRASRSRPPDPHCQSSKKLPVDAFFLREPAEPVPRASSRGRQSPGRFPFRGVRPRAGERRTSRGR